MTGLLPLMVALPLGTGFVLALLPDRALRAGYALAVAAAAALLLLALLAFGSPGSYDVGGWPAPVGINLALDGLSRLLLVLAAAVVFASVLFSAGGLKNYTGRLRFLALTMLMTAGINGTILSGDIFNRFVYVEIAVIASYVLVGFGGGGSELRAALRYGILGAAASAFALLGIAVIYGLYGTVNIAHLAGGVGPADAAGFTSAAFFGAVMMLVGFGYKSAAVPLHVWQPDALAQAPAPAAALIAGALIPAAGIYAMTRTVFTVFGAAEPLGWVILLPGTLSLVYGAAAALRRGGARSLASALGISQIGYVLVGLGVASILTGRGERPAAGLALAGAIYHLLTSAAGGGLLLLDSGAGEIAGRPGWPGLIGAGTLAGLPPLGGFFSKLMIVAACWRGGFPFLAAAGAAGLLAGWAAFFLHRTVLLPSRKTSVSEPLPPAMTAGLLLLAALNLALILPALPAVRAEILEPARAAILDREAYAAYLPGGEIPDGPEAPELEGGL